MNKKFDPKLNASRSHGAKYKKDYKTNRVSFFTQKDFVFGLNSDDALVSVSHKSLFTPIKEHIRLSVPTRIKRIAESVVKHAAGKKILNHKALVSALDLSTVTDFRRKVYFATIQIPAGEVRTYGEIAHAIKSPKASRAVGQALRHNQHLVIIPCHRVVSSKGMGGFAGQTKADSHEMEFKYKLLKTEGFRF